MKQDKPFSNPYGYTEINNAIFDYVLPNIEPESFSVLSAIFRQTLGEQRYEVVLSYGYLKNVTGISDRSIITKAIRELESIGIVTVTEIDNLNALYKLNRKYKIYVPDSEDGGAQ